MRRGPSTKGFKYQAVIPTIVQLSWDMPLAALAADTDCFPPKPSPLVLTQTQSYQTLPGTSP